MKKAGEEMIKGLHVHVAAPTFKIKMQLLHDRT